MPTKLDGPIPGSSLTREPGNAPWEQPPMITDTNEAISYHLRKFENEEVIDDLLFLLEQEFPISTFVECITSMAVMEGVHTVDVSVLVSPVIHEYIKAMADAAEIKYVEDDRPTKEQRGKARKAQRFEVLLQKALSESGGESELIDDLSMGLGGAESPAEAPSASAMPSPSLATEGAVGGPPASPEASPPITGLMSRRA